MRKLQLILILLALSVACYAPGDKFVTLLRPEPINRYENLWRAVCLTESSKNPRAYNKIENAVGIAQIRQIRIKDYNQKTGSNYKLIEMYDTLKAKKVFMYYAVKIGDNERIARSWNGSGKETREYWKRVKKELK